MARYRESKIGHDISRTGPAPAARDHSLVKDMGGNGEWTVPSGWKR